MIRFQQKIDNPVWGCVVAILLSLVVMSVYLLIATRTTLWDRNEPRFARATVEMVESGNYLIPTFNGRLRPDKPILIYWLMSLPIKLLGPTELACRFFGAVGTGLGCLLTFVIGWKLFGVKAGLWAMAVLASNVMMLYIGSAATTDAVLLPCMIAAVAAFVSTLGSGVRLWQTVFMGIALGLALLAKGPVGLLPLVVVAATLWLGRKVKVDIGRYLWQLGLASIIGILIFMAWAIPANNATGGQFLSLGIGHHVLGRAVRPLGHGGNALLYLPYYLPVLALGFFPWTLHLPGALAWVFRGRIGGQPCRALLVSWMLSVFIIMTLVVTKRSHYVLFMWPAMALAAAGTILAEEQNELNAQQLLWLRRGIWLFAPVAAVGALGLIVGPWFVQVGNLRWSGLASGIVLAGMAIIAIRRHSAKGGAASAKVLLIGTAILQIPILFGLLPAIEQLKLSPAIARVIKEKTSKETPVATYRYGEPSLNFYIGRKIEQLQGEDAVIAWAQQTQPGVLVIPKDVLADIQQRHGLPALEEIASKKGLNFSKVGAFELVAMVRKVGSL
jgi:4-amino-4-deoxy-L-arabinose transferase-like glycosyltransferase